jgi:hypothetical protein
LTFLFADVPPFDGVAHRQFELGDRVRAFERDQRTTVSNRHELNAVQPFQCVRGIHDDDRVVPVGRELRRPYGAHAPLTALLDEADDCASEVDIDGPQA